MKYDVKIIKQMIFWTCILNSPRRIKWSRLGSLMQGQDIDHSIKNYRSAAAKKHARIPALKATADDVDGAVGSQLPFVPDTGAVNGTGEGDEAFPAEEGGAGGNARGVGSGGGVDDDDGPGFGCAGGGEDGNSGDGMFLKSLLRMASTTTMRRSPALQRPASALMKK
jgi:hypothetical protein